MTASAIKAVLGVVNYVTMPTTAEPKPTPDAHELKAHVRAKGEAISEYTAQAVLDLTHDAELAEIALTMDPRPMWVQEIACRWR